MERFPLSQSKRPQMSSHRHHCSSRSGVTCQGPTGQNGLGAKSRHCLTKVSGNDIQKPLPFLCRKES